MKKTNKMKSWRKRSARGVSSSAALTAPECLQIVIFHEHPHGAGKCMAAGNIRMLGSNRAGLSFAVVCSWLSPPAPLSCRPLELQRGDLCSAPSAGCGAILLFPQVSPTSSIPLYPAISSPEQALAAAFSLLVEKKAVSSSSEPCTELVVAGNKQWARPLVPMADALSCNFFSIQGRGQGTS